MIERILKAFNKNLPVEKRENTWEWCYAYNKTVPITEDNLNNMADNNLCFGFFGGSYIGNDEKSHQDRAIYSVNKLAELLGTGNDLNSIEKGLGFEIHLPEFIGGRKVWQTERGIISDRHCHYLWVLKRIIDMFPSRKARIVEVGAGLGLLGYFLDKAGFNDYTTIDLAYAGACQAYFLHKNLPKRSLILSGEKPYPLSHVYRNSFKLLHTVDFTDIKERFDIMVNMDSFPEMHKEEAIKYFTANVPLILSINRENYNFRVCDLITPYRSCVYRRPFTLRADSAYFEELYK